MCKFKDIVDFIKSIYKKEYIALHEPLFIGNEKKYVNDCIDSTFVSSIGEYVNRVEKFVSNYTGSNFAIATVNGTAALHLALYSLGIGQGDEVITQPFSFIATANAIQYTGADTVFVDIDKNTLGMSPEALNNFLKNYATIDNGKCKNKITGKTIKAVVPMHTFGHPCKIDKIQKICYEWNLILIEDAAESLGSKYKDKHTGTFGKAGILSFNGNKIVTSGGGGMVVTNDENLAKKMKHLSTTAKVSQKRQYYHDELGFNYRMPNLNAALLLGQLENLEKFLEVKRRIAKIYKEFFDKMDIEFIDEPENSKSNFWLNAIVFDNVKERDEFLEYSNSNGVAARPAWTLLNKLPMYKNMLKMDLKKSYFFENRIVNIPSGVVI